MTRLILFILAAWSCGPRLHAQQQVMTSQYMYNAYQHNPAYAGLDRSLSVTAHYRSQYVGLEGSPTTAYINAHMPWYLWNGAIGLELYSDRLGLESNTAFGASYNYVQGFGVGIWSIGARMGILQKRIDGSSVVTPTGLYEGSVISHNDPLLATSLVSGIGVTYELGTYVMTDLIEGGMTVSRLPASNVAVGSASIDLATHVSGFFQYTYPVSSDLIIKPSIMLRSDLVAVQSDVAVMAEINGSIFGGIGLRGYNSTSMDAIVFSGGLVINENYRLIYSFDTGLSELKRVTQGTHELTLNYNLRKIIGAGMSPPVIYNPRNL